MKISNKTIISLITSLLVMESATGLVFANPEVKDAEIKNAINQEEPFVITGEIPNQSQKDNISEEQIIIQYLNKLQTTSTFKFKSKEDDKADSQVIVRLQQYIKNIPIYGSDIVACIDYNGEIKSISGYIESTQEALKNFKTTFKINKGEAINIAIEKFGVSKSKNKNIDTQLYVYKNIDEYKLAYKVDLKMIDTQLQSQTIFIDANDGSIIRQSENINNLVQPKIANAKGVFGDDKEIQVAYKQGEANFADGNYFIDNTRGKNPIKTVDLKGQYYFQYDLINSMEKDIKYYTQNLEQSDGKFVDAHYYVGKAYDFYHDTLNRDGIDTNGSKPVVLANVNNPGNAFYIQDKGIDVLAFGNGDSENYDASGSIDIVGHEYTHSIVQHTAKLEYEGQSGAIDEAYGDIFGTLIEHSYKTDKNWIIGEDMVKNGYLRDLSNPNVDDVDKLKVCNEIHTHNLRCDNNYVHYNSEIIDKVAYLISQGGIHNDINIEGIGEKRMGEIFYNALTEGLYSQSNFKHLGEVLISKTKTSTEKETVENALKSVGIIDSQVGINEIIGSTRYETATKISQSGWSEANNVVLINSSAMADALSSTPFAKSKNAPILLTQSNKLNEETKKEISRLKAKNVYVIGGSSVVSDNVISELKSMGLTVDRISGDDRYMTSLEVAKRLGNISEIAFVNGETGIPDGVSIAPVASTKNMPIALVSPRDGAKVFNEYINYNNIKASYIIGKQSAISNEITNKLPNAKRLGGNDRDETNAIIIKEFYNDNNLNNMFVTKDGMDKEDNLIDALSIGVLASKEASPVVIVGKNLNEKQEEVLYSKKPKILTQVGGNGNENAFERIKQLYN
ncbi:cell wall-binding repeat-containing protein [Romboutsia sedimentorum]|uniref:Cell wall-binding repeat-containing protein n=1 Tax=Romboutsia sedimentorum TaxID=1368474 RepID=A0ABT7EA02_9FIRM|nr:cell wall-binding repeat-containing protein [Romboutsia sedimentorum]MDK2563758.1 cell wall-binding repeat-containing protein [Romboutsia sedimentorum]